MMRWLRILASRDEAAGAIGRHALLLASLVLLLVALPVGQIVAGATPRFSILLGLVLVAAILVNSYQRWIFVVALLTGATALTGIVAAELIDSQLIRIGWKAMALSLLGFTSLVMLNSLVQADRVSRDTIVGGICLYLVIGLSFTMSFILLTEIVPGALAEDGVAIARTPGDASSHATKLLYFSFVTLTTLGYGDVVPVGDLAQMLAVAEAITGQLYLAIFVARLVGLYVGERRPWISD